MNIVVIGFGLIGKTRAEALQKLKNEGRPIHKIGIYDPFISKDKRDDRYFWYNSLEDAEIDKPDWVIICTPHDVAVQTVIQIVAIYQWDCKVLMEKPFGRNLAEAEEIYRLFGSNNREDGLFVGFNYRFYPGIQHLYDDICRQKFGKIINMHFEIGHGGEPSHLNSWKSSPEQNGQGALLDPAVHCLDLIDQFSTFYTPPTYGYAYKGFWNTGIQEEVLLHLISLNEDGVSPYYITLKSSLVQWRSTFRIEVWGDEGYGIITGRGKSYGPMEYVRGKRWGWQDGKSQKESEELVSISTCKNSFYDELKELLFGCEMKTNLYYRMHPATARQAIGVMHLYDNCLEIIE